MQLLMLIISVILLCLTLSFAFSRTKKARRDVKNTVLPKTEKNIKYSEAEKAVLCPICSSVLHKGDRVKSIAFPSINNERIAHIKGCPHCIAGEELRFCPVCKAILRKDEILTARMIQENGKTSMKIFGCSHCGGKASELR